MSESKKSKPDLLRENEELKIRLEEAEDTLRAIREGEVDAVVVSGSKGEQIFSLVGTDSIYRLIVETMKEAAFTLAFDGKILFCNAQFGEFVKCPLEQITGRPLAEFVAEANLSAAASLLVAAQQQPVRQRLVFKASDGAAVPAHVSANVLNQPDGLSICVVASDLTELENSTELIQQLRRQQEALQAANEELAATEEELRVQNEELAASRAELDRTRARYQDLFETAPDGYLVTDSEGTIQEVNQAAARLLGASTSEMKGNPFSALLLPAYKEGYLQLLTSLNAGTRALPNWEVEIRALAGRRFWASVTAAASYDEQGRIVGLRWLISDITPRRRAEEALRESQHRLTIATDAAQLGIHDYDITSGTIQWDARMRKLWGMAEGEPITFDTFMAGLHEEDRAPTKAALDKALDPAGDGSFCAEYRVISRSDGKERWVAATGKVSFEQGRAVRLVGTAQDISERKRAEMDLRRANEGLAQAADELARSNKDLEQFAYVASHDLQEPLRMVTGFLQLLRDRYKEQLDAKAQEYISFSVDGANRMSNLIKDLLDYSRAGAKEMEKAAVDLSAVAKYIQANLRATIAESDAVITVDPLPTVVADLGQMRQLLQNLVANAIKFRLEGRRPEIRISARRDGAHWVFQVKDNGIGIPPAQRDRIFVIFQRLHAREKYAGTGIGLAICKKIVERHGGRIWVESQPQEGSTFFFTLPAAGK